MKNQIIEVDRRRWLVREALSFEKAVEAIAHARVTGSIGHKDVLDKRFVGGGEIVIADVHEINSDGTLREAYKAVY